MAPTVRIGDRLVGPGRPCFVIAEAGVNHDGDLALAHRLVDAAADAGVDAVKFQTFVADALVVADAPKAPYQAERTGGEQSSLEMLRALELAPEAHERLFAHCRDRGIAFLSTPFDVPSLELLVRLGVPALKIASPDMTNPLLLEPAAATGLPLLVSTGFADLDEVERAVDLVGAAGRRELVLLHCVSAYPAPVDELNLRAIGTLAERFSVPVGFSDHSLGLDAPVAAAALGAAVIEKHLTLDSRRPGPDHAASLEPDGLAALVRSVRAVESALGDGVKRPTSSEEQNRLAARRSLAAAVDLDAGTVVTREMLTALRPASGIPAAAVGDVVGRTLARPVRRGELLSPSVLA